MQWYILVKDRGDAQFKLQIERLRTQPGQENTPRIDKLEKEVKKIDDQIDIMRSTFGGNVH